MKWKKRIEINRKGLIALLVISAIINVVQFGVVQKRKILIITESIELSNNIIIPKGTIIEKVEDLPEGCSIYALYFKSWTGLELDFTKKDSLNPDILKTYLIKKTKNFNIWVKDSELVAPLQEQTK